MEKNEFVDLLNSKTNSRRSMQYRKSSKRQLQQTLLTCYSYERPCPPQIRVNHLGFQELRRSSLDALRSDCSGGGGWRHGHGSGVCARRQDTRHCRWRGVVRHSFLQKRVTIVSLSLWLHHEVEKKKK